MHEDEVVECKLATEQLTHVNLVRVQCTEQNLHKCQILTWITISSKLIKLSPPHLTASIQGRTG